MAIVTNITKRVDMPHEDGWMEFKKLSWRQLELAAEIQTEDSLNRMKALGGDMLKALRGLAKEQEQESQKYDRAAILDCGILKWSYDEEVNKENIDLLDEETASWAYNEILSMHQRTEEETKNA